MKRVTLWCSFLCLAATTLLQTGCTSNTLFRLPSGKQHEQLLLNGHILVKGVELAVRGDSLSIPLFKRYDQVHFAGYADSLFRLSLHNRSASTKRVSLIVEHEGGSKQTSFSLPPGSAPIALTPTSFPSKQQKDARAIYSIRFQVETIGRHAKSKTSHTTILSYQTCRAYSTRGICPPSCLCAAMKRTQLASFTPTLRRFR